MSEREIKNQAEAIFRGAAEYIRKYGWQVSGMSEHGLPRCSMGALASAHPDEVWDKDLAKFMYNELYEELDGLRLTQFNYLNRNGEKVAELFERVADKLSRMSPVHYIEAL